MDLSADLHKKISLILGKEVLLGEQGNVASFAEFTESDIAEIRLLESKSGILAISYIRFRLQDNVALNRVVSYYSSVIQQGLSVKDWMQSP